MERFWRWLRTGHLVDPLGSVSHDAPPPPATTIPGATTILGATTPRRRRPHRRLHRRRKQTMDVSACWIEGEASRQTEETGSSPPTETTARGVVWTYRRGVGLAELRSFVCDPNSSVDVAIIRSGMTITQGLTSSGLVDRDSCAEDQAMAWPEWALVPLTDSEDEEGTE